MVLFFYLMDLIKYSFVFTVFVLYSLFPVEESVLNTTCFALILLFGIPHGAVDHKINSSINKNENTLIFILRYVLISVGYIFWWILLPGKAFVFFLIISAYHFSQEMLESLKVKDVKLLDILFIGNLIIVVPLLISYGSIKNNIEDVLGFTIPEVSFTLRILFVLLIISLLFYHFSRKMMDRRKKLSLMFFAVFIVFTYSLLPFILAFTLYFVLFHSFNVLSMEYKWFKNRLRKYSILSFVKDLLLFSVLGISGIVLFVVFINSNTTSETLTYFFIAISVITLPHVLLFDSFYKANKNI